MKTVRIFLFVLKIFICIWNNTVADKDYKVATFKNGTMMLNCTTQRHKIHIESADYNSSMCSGTNGSILQDFTNLCNGKSFCEFVVLDSVNDLNLTCLRNETAEYLLDIYYYCTQDGMWSAWSEYSTCSLTCGGGVQSRSRLCNDPAPNRYGQNCTGSNVEQKKCNKLNCSNPIVKMYTEGELAHLTCSVEYKETMDIISINYIHGTCSHSETYGIGNLCNGKTNCSFDVSNSNIGSSCGANGRATLEVKYNCIRNGGWSDWNTSYPCPVSCGGAIRNVSRTCSNPHPNAIGDTCTGDDVDEQTCNTHNCIDQNTACLEATVNWNCPDGIIKVDKAIWETSRACGDGYISFKSLNVLRKMKSTCENRRNCTFVANDHNFGESCSTSISKCTIFDYVYSCFKATWDVWSSWSECTKSCGSGIQTRQRQCLNQMNTTDGYVTECDGIGTGSRSCNTALCPYCNDNHFQYTSIQWSSDLKEDTSSGSGYLLLNGIYTINCCGRIKMWEFVPVNTGRLIFVIMRKTTDNKYKFVGSNQIDISATDLRKSTQFNVSEDKRIVITKGDIIGWFDTGSNIVGFHDCLPNNEICPLSYRLRNDIGEGDVVDITSLSGTSGKSYTVNYSTVENRPIAFDVPSKPIYIPDNLNMDASVMTIPISDLDYGDYIQNFILDYNNEYFYFDTKMRNVYVKKELPHTVGQMFHSLNITLTVQDSCYNEVTSNVNIIVYNVPPVISGLQNNLEIDPATAESDPYLAKFQVKDPSGDNVSCMINETNAATELFYLQLDNIDVYLKLANNVSIQSNTSSEFILTVICGDGTENTEFELKLKFRPKNEGTSTIPSNEPSAIPIIIGVCVFIVCLIILVILVCIWKKRRKLVVNETSEDKLKYATCSVGADVIENPYHDMGQTVDQHKPNDYVEMSGKPPEKEKAFHLGTSEVGAYTEAWR